MKQEAKKLFRFLRTKPVPENTNEILALERTKLANERTLLSYIRSSLYLLLGGIALLQVEDFQNIQWLGYVALFVCVIFFGCRCLPLCSSVPPFVQMEPHPFC